MEVSSAVHLDETSIEVGLGSIELHAVLDILFEVVVNSSVLGEKFLVSQAVGLVKVGEAESNFVIVEEPLGVEVIGVQHGGGVSKRADLDDVGSVGGGGSFSVVVSGVGVATSPLEVYPISSAESQMSGDEVVFGGGISLDDVTTLSTDVQVEDASTINREVSSVGNLADFEGVSSVLESASELIGINGQRNIEDLVGVGVNVDVGISLQGSGFSVLGRVGSPGVEVCGGHVVSETKNSLGGNVIWDGPVEESGDGIAINIDHGGITEVVVSLDGSGQAKRSGDSPGGINVPGSSVGKAFLLVIVLSLRAKVAVLDVLGFRFVPCAFGSVISEDDDILPWRGMPVGVVISFFLAFETAATSSTVLTGVASVVSNVLIGDVKTLVAFTGRAVLVIVEAFVHSVQEGLASWIIDGGSVVGEFIFRDGFSGGTITNFVTGLAWVDHVLNDQLAVDFIVSLSTSVLRSPFNTELRSDVEEHARSPAVSSGIVILGVEETVVVIHVSVCFTVAIV